MADVYLSYSRTDREFASLLAKALESSGVSVWSDSALTSGSNFRAEVDRELKSAKAVIVIWSPDSVSSEFVRDEAQYAYELAKLIPIQINDVRLPLGFNRIQTLLMDSWQGDTEDRRFAQLLRYLERRGIELEKDVGLSDIQRLDQSQSSDAGGGEDNERNSPIFESKPEDRSLESSHTDVFVAYSRRDSIRCEDLILHLRRQELDVFFDQFIRSGAAWRQSIASHIIGCSVFVVILSEHSVISQEVRNEINLATTHGKKIIPVFVQDVTLPGDFELILSGLNYVHAFEDFDRHFVEAAEEAKTLVALEAFNARRALVAKAGTIPKSAKIPSAKFDAVSGSERSVSVIWISMVLAIAVGFSVSLFVFASNAVTLSYPLSPFILFSLAFFLFGLPYAIFLVLGIRNVARVASK